MPEMIPAWLDGTLTPVEKLRVHREGLRHKAVSVFVMAGNAVLLQRRARAKYHTPGLWTNTCCTHPGWNEGAGACAIRRLAQEMGITGLIPRHRDRIEYRADVGGGMTEHEVVDLFVARTAPGLALAPDPAEVMEVRWQTLPALADEVARDPARFTPWLRIYLEKHGAQLFGPCAAG